MRARAGGEGELVAEVVVQGGVAVVVIEEGVDRLRGDVVREIAAVAQGREPGTDVLVLGDPEDTGTGARGMDALRRHGDAHFALGEQAPGPVRHGLRDMGREVGGDGRHTLRLPEPVLNFIALGDGRVLHRWASRPGRARIMSQDGLATQRARAPPERGP